MNIIYNIDNIPTLKKAMTEILVWFGYNVHCAYKSGYKALA